MWYNVQQSLSISALFFNFLPSWWNKGYGITFGERYVFDPGYRTETLRFMERTVAGRFPQLGIGSADARPTASLPDFGNAVTPALAGCAVAYPQDNYPWNEHLPASSIAGLRVAERLEEAFPYTEIVRQAAWMTERLGQPTAPLFPPRGVQNDAVLIQGTDFLEDLLSAPQKAQQLLEFTSGVLRAAVERNTAVYRRPDRVIICNCTAIMASPQLYQDSVQPYELAIQSLVSSRGREFGIHHCGILDPFIAQYRAFPRVDFLEIGWGSDVAATLLAFPEAMVQYIFLPTVLLNASIGEIRAVIRRLTAVAGDDRRRFSISVPDIEHGTPDANLYAILEECMDGGGKHA
jgi:hypothetical protein